MLLRKRIGIKSCSVFLLAGVLLFNPITTNLCTANAAVTTSATNYKITVETQYVNRYTPARRICGYVKDSNGDAIANQTVYIAKYNSRYDIPHANEVIESVYDAVKTDSDGYYSTWAYDSGFYVAYLSSEANSSRATTYALVSSH